jgi:hypothetical protein
LEEKGGLQPRLRDGQRINAHAEGVHYVTTQLQVALLQLSVLSRVRGKVSIICLGHPEMRKSPRREVMLPRSTKRNDGHKRP